MPGNAARFGFLQSFTPGSASGGMGYMPEPWHWSYYPVARALLRWFRRPAPAARPGQPPPQSNEQRVEDILRVQWAGVRRPAAARTTEFTFIESNWRSFVQNVNETPQF
jgi:hypothetical protein